MKSIYFFDEGDGKNRKLLGGKGAGLCEMTRLKLPVPPGFVITTEVCKNYYENNKTLSKNLISEVKKNIAKIEKKTGKKWNSKEDPLLVSVRSGASISMPGMMDTILNLGLNEETVLGLAKKSNITKDIADRTAVNVVTMAFGNMGNDSATGVVFTRNPADGTKKIFGEYLVNAQGEDVVAGVRTPKSVDQ